MSGCPQLTCFQRKTNRLGRKAISSRDASDIPCSLTSLILQQTRDGPLQLFPRLMLSLRPSCDVISVSRHSPGDLPRVLPDGACICLPAWHVLPWAKGHWPEVTRKLAFKLRRGSEYCSLQTRDELNIKQLNHFGSLDFLIFFWCFLYVTNAYFGLLPSHA